VAAGSSDPALFVSRTGARLTTRSLDRIVRRLAAEADVEASAHTLRHTWATRMLRAGVDVVTVAELAGHARLETTRGYTLPTPDDLAAAIEAGGVEY
jgi:integrase/recombinase XerC